MPQIDLIFSEVSAHARTPTPNSKNILRKCQRCFMRSETANENQSNDFKFIVRPIED